MKIVDDFMETEQTKLNWLEKLSMNYPEFYFAKNIAFTKNDYDLKSNIIIKPSIFKRTIASVFIFMGLIAWLIFVNMVLQNILFPITLVFLLLITTWTGFIIWTYYINPKYSYKIIMDKNEFRVNKLSLPWDSILEALIMVKGAGRHMVSTLVIFTNDNRVYKYSLQNLNVSNDRILKLIEGYRKKTNA